MPRITILVVEDEPLVRMAVTDFLRTSDFDVIEAEDAGQAVAILDGRTDISLVITDVRMPGPTDGIGLAKFAAARWPHLRVLITSGHRLLDAHDLPERVDFLPKPYRLDQLNHWAQISTRRS
jgi:DNA-binding NtrC family response regulator